MMQMGGPMVQARNFAVMTGTNAGISAFMRRYRRVDDIQNSLVAAFGSGAGFWLVSGMGPKPAIPGATAPNPLMNVTVTATKLTTPIAIRLLKRVWFSLVHRLTITWWNLLNFLAKYTLTTLQLRLTLNSAHVQPMRTHCSRA